jgi:ribonucleoside-diphosphate reductase alpha chain
MHGNQPNRCAVLDTIIKESVPDCYADLGSQPYQRIRAAKYPSAPTTAAASCNQPLQLCEDPFTDKANFNFELYKEHVGWPSG